MATTSRGIADGLRLLSKGTIVLTLAATFSSDAWACRRFSVWRYPTPQRCRVMMAMRAEAPQEDRSWYVEIPLPLAWEGEPLWAIVANRIDTRF